MGARARASKSITGRPALSSVRALRTIGLRRLCVAFTTQHGIAAYGPAERRFGARSARARVKGGNRLTRSQRADIVTARAWARVIRRLDLTRANRQWNRMDTLTVQALRLYVALLRDIGEPAQMRLDLEPAP